VASLPASPETVTEYLAWLADQGRKTGTLQRRLAAVRLVHEQAGEAAPGEDPRVRRVMAGIRRTLGSEQTRKQPVSLDLLRRMLEYVDLRSLTGLRDRALLLLGFAGGFRRSELVALRVEDLEWAAGGLVVSIRRSKGDPEGRGELVGVPCGQQPETCPVRAVEEWLRVAGIDSGPVFRATLPGSGRVLERGLNPKRVAICVQRLAALAGLDPRRFGGHSLRSGLATAAAEGGASEQAIMQQTRHKSVQQVRRYVHRGSIFADNAASFTGL
jgi:integrase